MTALLTAYLVANAAVWLGFLVHHLANARRTPRLDGASPVAPPADPPLVSILLPCRNEASRILPACVRSLLAQTWPRFEVIAVDDRSTDDTGALLAALAAEDDRLAVVRGVDPPAGWVGKTHALHQALAVARGEWILSTDADMLLHPSVLARAMARAAEQDADLVTLIPSDCATSTAARLVMPTAVWMIFWLFPPPATNNPRDPRALGCGGFLLLRREALVASGGYAAIAGDVADDVALAERVKRAGCRLHCALAPELLATPMYNSLGELWRGFRKNALRGVRHNLWLAAAAVVGNLLGSILPPLLALAALAAWAHPGAPAVAVAGAVAWLAQAAAFGPAYRLYGVPWWWALATPWAFTVMTGILIHAAWRTVTGQGLEWRGRMVPKGRA